MSGTPKACPLDGMVGRRPRERKHDCARGTSDSTRICSFLRVTRCFHSRRPPTSYASAPLSVNCCCPRHFILLRLGTRFHRRLGAARISLESSESAHCLADATRTLELARTQLWAQTEPPRLLAADAQRPVKV